MPIVWAVLTEAASKGAGCASQGAGFGKCKDLNRSAGPEVRAAAAYRTSAALPQMLLRQGSILFSAILNDANTLLTDITYHFSSACTPVTSFEHLSILR